LYSNLESLSVPLHLHLKGQTLKVFVIVFLKYKRLLFCSKMNYLNCYLIEFVNWNQDSIQKKKKKSYAFEVEQSHTSKH